MRECTGKFKIGPKCGTGRLFIASKLCSDTAFPFKTDDTVKISIDHKRLIVEATQ